MIKTVIRSADGMVLVFNERGEQLPEYQGRYEVVRGRILEEATPETRFGCFPDDTKELRIVPRQYW